MNGLSLIETMRFEPGLGIIRFHLHMARLGNSARKLGLVGSEAAEALLLEKIASLAQTSRVRLELFGDGHVEITATAFAPLPDDTVWTARIAMSAHLCSSEPIARHKTSRRDVYDTARGEFAGSECDEVILLNDKGEVSEGTITNIFVEMPDGSLLTPPLSSGCLAGVLRTSLICAGKARVAHLFPKDLAHRPFYLGNSLRGLIRGRLVADH